MIAHDLLIILDPYKMHGTDPSPLMKGKKDHVKERVNIKNAENDQGRQYKCEILKIIFDYRDPF
jgi:hypothetical protein